MTDKQGSVNWTDTYRRRTGATKLTKEGYFRTISLLILFETVLAVAGACTSFTWQPRWIPLVAFVVSLASFVVMFRATKATVMALAMAAASLLLGLGLGPIIAPYDSAQIIQAILFTGVSLVVMSVAGFLFPRLFNGWGPYLTAGFGVLVSILGVITLLGKPWVLGMPFINWAGIALFMAFVAFDWSCAIGSPHTLENAIWASALLFLDAGNIFLRGLETTDKQHPPEPDAPLGP